MAPLDTGSVGNLRVLEPLGRAAGPTSESYATLGAYLEAAREHRRVTLAALSELTRIRIGHLKAIEIDDFDALPNRPFAMGYVRAFAQALDLDVEAVVARFKREHPERPVPLQAPVGAVQADDRQPVVYVAVGALLAAVVLWNIAQRVLHKDAPAASGLAPAATASAPLEPAGPIKLSPPTPAPVEQTLPTPYVTPGLDPAQTGANPPPGTAPVAVDPAKRKILDGLLTLPDAPRRFEAHGAVYSEAGLRSPALIAARKSGSLVVRGADGRIYFARVLQPGEAYRAPLGRGLTADMSDPAAFDLYVGDQLRGGLTGEQTPLDKVAGPFLNAPPPAPVPAAPTAQSKAAPVPASVPAPPKP